MAITMGADAFYVYYGVKRSLEPDSSEMELLEREKHPIFETAFDAKLHVAWGRMTEGEDYFLLIGHQIGCFGVQHETYREIPAEEIRCIIEQTDQRLRQADITETPAFHCHLYAQY
jgi:peptidoglycan/xylan/chitin deacetylase (PgdA/CDA1 family)